MKHYLTFIFCMIVGLIMAAGCGGVKRPEGMPTLYKTTITFTQADAPLIDAMVILKLADSSHSKWYSGGATDANGIVIVRTQGDFPGAPVGKYKVLVSKLASEPNPKNPEGSLTFDLVEPQYNDFTKTPLEIEVKAEPENNFTLDVGAACKKEVK